MRLAFTAFFAVALFAVPFLSGAAPTPAPPLHVIVPDRSIKLATPSPTGPPVHPTTTTIWLKPVNGRQVTLSNITESMAPQGKHGCVLFTITASLNTADAVTILDFYNKNETIAEARIYVPPSVVYTITKGAIKSYNESAGPSGSSATFTLTEQKYSVTTGSNTEASACAA
jgi:hypothetical protein